ncbi:MAG: hypothetical protein KatS3mg009_1212 [Acidimicrobiia bacterium]|nr:MAG: hypothetical protein KatS3mg009_1212 [Acidimicrobiia bacterium]
MTHDFEVLLRRAFPWGVHVARDSGPEFVSVRYGVVESDPPAATATVCLEWDSGETSQTVTAADLERAAVDGAVRLPNGVRLRQPEVGDVHLLASPLRDLVGPQVPSDDPWVARMRLHQSWWRTFRLRVPFGYGPTPSSEKRYGNMIDEDAARHNRNFLTPEAARAYRQRVAEGPAGIDTWRTSRNLLASQTMAFNVFGHLGAHLDLATQLFAALLGDDEVALVRAIEMERLSDALGDRTAFDVFVTYERSGGGNGCVAIETKLTEPFSQRAYDWKRYLSHTAFGTDVWATSDASRLGDPRWSQLWRNHLLARAECARAPELGTATLMVVHHPGDPHCAANVDGYRALLHDPRAVRGVDLQAIVDTLRDCTAADDEHQQRWIRDLEDRYLDLRPSEGLIGLSD